MEDVHTNKQTLVGVHTYEQTLGGDLHTKKQTLGGNVHTDKRTLRRGRAYEQTNKRTNEQRVNKNFLWTDRPTDIWEYRSSPAGA